MTKSYGLLMSDLLQHRAGFQTDEEFKRFVMTAVSEFSGDLRDFDIEISLRPAVLGVRRAGARDWNPLHIGCE